MRTLKSVSRQSQSGIRIVTHAAPWPRRPAIRCDVFDFTEAERMQRWQTILEASAAHGDELHEVIDTGRLVDAVVPWT